MENLFIPNFKDEEHLRDVQLAGLKWTVSHAYQGSEFYKNSFDKLGIKPEDIKTIDDLKNLPFTTSNDLKENYPFPLLSVPFEKIVRIHASSGTTGRKKILVYTKKDLKDWANMFARCYELVGLSKQDRVQICVGYGLWTAGVGFQLGCEEFGALAIPAGPGNLELQMQFLIDFKPTVICATASMGLLLAEEVERRNLKNQINVKKVIFGAERSNDVMRDKIKYLLGAEDTFDIVGLTELYGPGMGIECKSHRGIHYWADHYIVELINPETLKPVEEGEMGELVYTTLRKEGAPLIRYRSRDITQLIKEKCPCGLPFPQHDRILGRSDDMFIVRGVNVYPGHIDETLAKYKHVGSEYQIYVERRNDGKDYMTIKVERELEADKNLDLEIINKIESSIKKSLFVSSKVEILDYNTLPRTTKKVQRVFDLRDLCT